LNTKSQQAVEQYIQNNWLLQTSYTKQFGVVANNSSVNKRQDPSCSGHRIRGVFLYDTLRKAQQSGHPQEVRLI